MMIDNASLVVHVPVISCRRQRKYQGTDERSRPTRRCPDCR